MAQYEIYKKGDLHGVLKVDVFNDPLCMKYTVSETLEKDEKDINNRIQIQIITQNPLIFDLYTELDLKSPLLEEIVHVDLLKALINFGANIRFALQDKHNLVSVAVQSKMNESQFHSLCSFLINEQKAYDLFSNYVGTDKGKARVDNEWNVPTSQNESCIEYPYDKWLCPVGCIFKLKSYLHFETLKMILSIPEFDINQTTKYEDEDTRTTYDLTLFQIANYAGKGLKVYKLMIEMGVNYETIGPNEFTPFTLAIFNEDYEAVDYYLSLGFYLEARDSNGFTPIFHASRNLKMIQYLRLKGADIYALDNDGFFRVSSFCY